MLNKYSIHAQIPALDYQRAKKFYVDTLGLKMVRENQDQTVGLFESANGTLAEIYQRADIKADHTIAGWFVDNIEAEVNELKSKGIVFEEYDEPGFRTINSIAKTGPNSRCAWFKDTEGNHLVITERKED